MRRTGPTRAGSTGAAHSALILGNRDATLLHGRNEPRLLQLVFLGLGVSLLTDTSLVFLGLVIFMLTNSPWLPQLMFLGLVICLLTNSPAGWHTGPAGDCGHDRGWDGPLILLVLGLLGELGVILLVVAALLLSGI